jgi:hypothetical protein
MKAYRVYTHVSGQEYTDEFDVGYFFDRDDAVIAAAKEAESDNARMSQWPSELPWQLNDDGTWCRRNHMGDDAYVHIEQIEIMGMPNI